MKVVVLGMHRSGTSLVSRLLNLMGFYFGAENTALLSANDNPKGFWERKDVVDINNKILRENGFDWFKISDLDKKVLENLESKENKQNVFEIVSRLDAFRPWFIKDPRLCLLLPIWEKFIPNSVNIFVYRDPMEVAYSLNKRNEFPIPFGLALWEKYNESALRYSEGQSRFFINYNELIQRPIDILSQLLSFFKANDDFGLRDLTRSEITEVIDENLYNQKSNKLPETYRLTSSQQDLLDVLKSAKPGLAKITNSNTSVETLRTYETIISHSMAYSKTKVDLDNVRQKLSLSDELSGEFKKLEKSYVSLKKNYENTRLQMLARDNELIKTQNSVIKQEQVINKMDLELYKKAEENKHLSEKIEVERKENERLEATLEKEEIEKNKAIKVLNDRMEIVEEKLKGSEEIKKSLEEKLKIGEEVKKNLQDEVNKLTLKVNQLKKRHERDIENQTRQLEKLKQLTVKKDILLSEYWDRIQYMRLKNRFLRLFGLDNLKKRAKKEYKKLENTNSRVKRPVMNERPLVFSKKSKVGCAYRINIITPSTNIHGGTKRLLTIAKLLSERGHHVKLIRQHSGRDLDWFDISIPILDIHFSESTPLETLENQIPNGDILMTYGNCRANSVLKDLSGKKGLKTVLFMHFGVHDLDLDIKNAKLKEFNLLATTSWIDEEIKQTTGREAELVDFGVHSDQFYNTGNKLDKFTIGGLYHKDDWKRSLDILEAYGELKGDMEINLVMFGQVKSPNLPAGVIYHYNPDQNLLREIYSSCDIWIMPSLYEGIGMCSVEAMLCEIPLITVDTGGSRDFCNEHNSTIVEKRSPSAIADAVNYLAQNPKVALEKAKRAHHDILEHSWDNSIDLFEAHFFNFIEKYNPVGFRSLDYNLTIGIPIHNELDYVKSCVASIRKHTTVSYQLVLVDDVSEPDTRQYLTSLSNEDVIYVRNYERRGFPFNCNEIIRHSSGKYICILNSDTVVTPNWDKYLIDALKTNPKFGMVGPSTSYGVAKNFDSIAQQLESVHFKRFEMSTVEIDEFAVTLSTEENEIISSEYLNGFCMMFDRSVVSEIGFFDVKFGLGSREEVQFIDRLRLAGYEMGWVKYSYVHHYGHRSFTNYDDSQALWEKNKKLYFETKGSEKIIGITNKKIGFIYNAKFASSTRKRTFEPHKYLREYLNIELRHWPQVDQDFIESCDVVIIQRLGGLNEKISEDFVENLFDWMSNSSTQFYYDLDDYIITPQNELPKRLIKKSKGAIVTTEALKSHISKLNSNTVVIENGVDYERFLKSPMWTKSEVLKIACFSLAGAGFEVLNELGNLLTDSGIKHDINLFSSETFDADQYPFVNLKKNVSLDELFSELKTTDYLINWGEHSADYIGKLVDQYGIDRNDEEDFINSKSGLKYYNAAVSQTILLSTPSPEAYSEIVKDGENGFIISGAKMAHDIILRLEANPKEKESIIKEAFQDTIAHYTLDSTSRKYLEFFSSNGYE